MVAAAVAAFAAALALHLTGGASPAAAAHLAFAAGILPLIAAALLHFVPVLTRSGPPPLAIRCLPPAFLLAGWLAAAAFLWPAWFDILFPAAAGIAFVAALMVAGWTARRGRATLGAPHPGLRWYLAALFCLSLALAAALAMPVLPGQRSALRLFHLHLNTLGFVGLTALGTLAVLLPTAVGQPDPQAAGWLGRMLTPALAGVLATAAGAAWWLPASWLGAVLLALPVIRLGKAWLVRFPHAIVNTHGPAASLALALAGLAGLLILGFLHGQRLLRGEAAVTGFLAAFLLPLVTGAASQLLPVWLEPGVQGDWHRAARARLGRYAAARAAAFVLAGWLAALGWPAAAWLAAVALAVFIAQALPVAARRPLPRL